MKNILSVAITILLVFTSLSCSEPGYVNEDYEEINSLTVELEKKDENLLIFLNSEDLYQCPSSLEIESFKDTKDYIYLELNDEIYFPASPCFAVYSPKPAGNVLTLPNNGSGEKELILKFGNLTVKGRISFGANPEVTFEKNCCIKVVTEESTSENRF